MSKTKKELNMKKELKQKGSFRHKILGTIWPLMKDSLYWFWHDLKYSSTTYRDECSDMATLMINSHVLEKGITMPDRRPGFGYDRVRLIISQCNQFIRLYGEQSIEIQSTLKDLEQYLELHKKQGFELPMDIAEGIVDLLKFKRIDTKDCFESTPDVFFEEKNDFFDFAHSRHTMRWYSDEPIPDDTIRKAVELAMTAPSACNRQSVRVHVVTTEAKKKKILELQNGNRGFGQLADKLLCVTVDSRYYAYSHRPMANVDGGIFTMNLLYALHYYKIAACTLNACLSIRKRKRLNAIIEIEDAEFPIVFVAIGRAPDHFMVAASQRLNVDRIVDFK